MDILGVGIDIVSIERVTHAVHDGGDAFMKKVFTPFERDSAATQLDPFPYLATAFAAKEAVFKTLDIDWDTGVGLHEIELHNAPSGQPYVVLSGRFAELARERRGTRVLLSLSYEREYAIASATLVSE